MKMVKNRAADSPARPQSSQGDCTRLRIGRQNLYCSHLVLVFLRLIPLSPWVYGLEQDGGRLKGRGLAWLSGASRSPRRGRGRGRLHLPARS
ncbi:hypothetical protein GALMADRAFT_272208 [Galerina marginata CBS 339.88]|uniref:Uncharacterized protein n=1 Tax=Galerina marginata (strain CBS 339.88) TaxID=685588 RepID=A0A067SQM6_GALM3|nr:hypothetical protein GALMADRAFT_272208 [Galerina marginata CBS 339.88]